MKGAAPAQGDARGLRVAIVWSGFNASIVAGLLEGARSALEGAALVEEFEVPGAFELPLAASLLARSRRFDALVALGAVIRGETDHYEHIARVASDGLARVAQETGIPVGFGVLTLKNEAQGLRRAGRGPANKGAEAAHAAVALSRMKGRLARRRRRG